LDTDSITQIILIIVLIALSAFFSSAETAFTTVNRIKMRTLIEEGSKRAQTVLDIVDNSGKMLSAILIGNNIVNISVSAIVTSFTIRVWGNAATGIATGILTAVILIFGEITPKTTATVYAEKFALAYAPVIKVIMTVLTPVIYIVERLSGVVLKVFHIDVKNNRRIITENELRTFVEVSHEDGVIESDERQIINNLFDFGDAEAKDIMIPRIDMIAADIEMTYPKVMELFRDTMYSRIPIYEEEPDNVVGILNIKDMIMAPQNASFNIKNIMRKPYFVYEHKNISELFKEMQFNSQSVAIVLDEYGSTAGMITTEDLLEEIVGDIRDEYDNDEKEPLVQLNEHLYRVAASYKLDDLNDELSLSLESEDNDSVGGYIIEKLDRFPSRGDRLDTDKVEFLIEKAEPNRIVSIILKLKDTPSV
jgi:CBS domain containing-hemolysin-like protein